MGSLYETLQDLVKSKVDGPGQGGFNHVLIVASDIAINIAALLHTERVATLTHMNPNPMPRTCASPSCAP